MTPEDEEELAILATPVRVPAADPADQPGPLARARDLTAMRELMAAEADARVLLGGRIAGQQGRWPGIVEEAYLALRAGQPLYVAGGLGGAAARVAEALRGSWPEVLTDAFQRSHTEAAARLIEAGPGVTEEDLRATLVGAALGNGLGGEENEQLLQTADLDVIVALIMRGLGNVAGS
jgi:hypothetical protein